MDILSQQVSDCPYMGRANQQLAKANQCSDDIWLPVDVENPHIVSLAEFAVKESGHELVFLRVLLGWTRKRKEPWQEPERGNEYCLILVAQDICGGVLKLCKAMVYDSPCELISFDILFTCDDLQPIEYQELGKWAVAEQKKYPNLVFIRVQMGCKQDVRDATYYCLFITAEEKFVLPQSVPHTYFAIVSVKKCNHSRKLECFELVV